MSPETVNTSGVVGQATSFDLTLTGGSPYTYTQTFGNICAVSINNDTATVTITPTTSGTLTGSITFDNQATCNITIDVSEPQPEQGFQPDIVNSALAPVDTASYTFTLLPDTYDSSTENLEFAFSTSGSSEFTSSINVSEDILTNPDRYVLTIETDNTTGDVVSGYVNVYANIFDKATTEYLRNYSATINLTVEVNG